jgi:murein L,D-transpeptidase YafK
MAPLFPGMKGQSQPIGSSIIFQYSVMKRYIITATILLSLISSLGVIDVVHARANTQALPQADHVVVIKGARTLTLMRQGKMIKTYKVSLGREPVGPKEKAGDSKTPEGDYLIDGRNPRSKFHLALHISYPGPQDKIQAERGGRAPGGAIMIHGRPNWSGWIRALYEDRDWTDGCIAVSNAEMEEIWSAVPDGTPISILP